MPSFLIQKIKRSYCFTRSLKIKKPELLLHQIIEIKKPTHELRNSQLLQLATAEAVYGHGSPPYSRAPTRRRCLSHFGGPVVCWRV